MKNFHEAAQSAANTIRQFLAGEWDGNAEGWEAVAEQLEKALSTINDESKSSFVVMQEGGSSGELYLHVFDSARTAELYRFDCNHNGAYRTSPPVEVPASLADHPEFFGIVETIRGLADEVEYAEGDPTPGWGIQKCYRYLDANDGDFPEPNPWDLTRDGLIEEIRAAGYRSIGDDCETDEELLSGLINLIDRGEVPGLDDWRQAVKNLIEQSTR